ncbi:MAG: hypothetical protein KJO07_15600 [Deltaproteobacteria bacterium]|nr:hypothetical protein [Deltaproteobacteria bacterium]
MLLLAGAAHGKGRSSKGSSGGGGPLSQTASGVSSRTSSGSGSSSSSSSSSSGSSSSSSWDDDDGYDWDDDDVSYGYAVNPRANPSVVRLQPPGATPARILYGKPDFEVSVRGMNVIGSGGALDASAHAQSGLVRIFGGNSSFFEDQGGGDTLVVNVYRAGLGLGLGSVEGGTRLFIDAGVSGFESPSDSLLGGMAQLELRRRLMPKVWLDGFVRGYWMEYDVRALDVGVGLRASVVRLGFRNLDFNVGPPLYGPELGLSFAF